MFRLAARVLEMMSACPSWVPKLGDALHPMATALGLKLGQMSDAMMGTMLDCVLRRLVATLVKMSVRLSELTSVPMSG
jgi:hypothetical protein